MIVLDANILIRAVLGRRVRQLIDAYAGQGVRFFAPDVAFDDAEKYLPPLLKKRGKSDADLDRLTFVTDAASNAVTFRIVKFSYNKLNTYLKCVSMLLCESYC